MNTTASLSQEPLILEVIDGQEFLFRCFSDDPEPPHLFLVRDGEIHSIGRGSSCGIRLSGGGSNLAEGCIVARRHVDLKRDHGVVSIFDNFGRARGGNFAHRVFLNGCCLAGVGQEWHQVGVGDEFSVGPVTFQLRRRKPKEPLDLAAGE